MNVKKNPPCQKGVFVTNPGVQSHQTALILLLVFPNSPAYFCRREMSWVGVWRVRNRGSASAWRVAQMKAERGSGREEGRQPQADESGRDQVGDKRYEIDVAEGARREKQQ